ncbi:MAG: hypothetical protein E6G39_04835 [Actinobacteria bacterium]|nr:MAG: hypothetical protein E6G39_04835 [Actinomycetota bacterium]
MTNSERRSEVDKLWAAVKRDYFGAIETFTGIRGDQGDRRWNRLLANWRALCELDIDRASLLARGLREVSMLFDAHLRGPADGHLDQLDEVHDVVRALNPDPDLETFGSTYALGEEALQRRLDEDPGRL